MADILYSNAKIQLVNRERTFINALLSTGLGRYPNDLSIVVHGTGSSLNADGSVVTAGQIADFFGNNAAEVSTHFIIGRDGSVIQSVALQDGAGGNCCVEKGHDAYWQEYIDKYANLNLCSISIEHCNDSNNSLTPTQEQLNASIRLVAWLCYKFNIPVGRIKTHASIDPISRAHCPGNAIGNLSTYQQKVYEVIMQEYYPTNEINELKSQIVNLGNEIQTLRTEIADLTKELTDAYATIDQLETQHAEQPVVSPTIVQPATVETKVVDPTVEPAKVAESPTEALQKEETKAPEPVYIWNGVGTPLR